MFIKFIKSDIHMHLIKNPCQRNPHAASRVICYVVMSINNCVIRYVYGYVTYLCNIATWLYHYMPEKPTRCLASYC